MKGTYLGEFEELVLLSVGVLQQEAYGLAIKKELEDQTQRKVSISAVHASCNRLEEKGYLTSHFGEKTQKRGGRRKKIYAVSLPGQKALQRAQHIRKSLWDRLPPNAFTLDFA
ncbi:MAG: PadR family transcriptional regulator [Bacteroidota bacterium]